MESLRQQSALLIERLHNHYLAPAEHPAPEDIRSFCEAAIGPNLPQMLASVLHPWLPAEDNSVWFLRRLEIDFSLNVEETERNLAELWAAQIAAGLMGALQNNNNDEETEILRFPSRAAYLAHFLLDLAEASAWSKWYYQSFDGLRVLPLSTALRTAICEEPETGLAALGQLPEHKSAAVLRALCAADARRVLAALSGTDRGAGDEAACFNALREVWQTALSIPPNEEDHRALLLFIAAYRKNPELAGKPLAAAAAACNRLVRRLRESAATQSQGLLTALRDGDLAGLCRATDADDAAILAPLLRCESGSLEMVLQNIAGESSTGLGARPETQCTSFGGMYLLLPLLEEVPWEEATSGWPVPEGVSAPALTRLLVLAKCLGRSRAAGCFRDPVVLDCLQVPPEITRDMDKVARWLAGISAKDVHRFLSALLDFRMETGAVQGDTFLFVRAAQKGRPAGILLDHARGLWLFAGGLCNSRSSLFQQLGNWIPQPRRLLCDECFVDEMRASFPNVHVEPLPGAPGEGLPPLRELARDLTYLSLAGIFPRKQRGARMVDLALSVAAQGMLRSFAWKLPGFGNSSLGYLYNNFLACTASVKEDVNQNIVCLGRPPLHLVLAMAGLNRRSYRLSWAPDRTCTIFPEG